MKKKIGEGKFFNFFIYSWKKIFHTLIKNCNLLIPRAPKLQEKPSALKRKHPAPQNMKFLMFYFYFRVIFCPPRSGFKSGSTNLTESGSVTLELEAPRSRNFDLRLRGAEKNIFGSVTLPKTYESGSATIPRNSRIV
jgi:hypothetical protein